MTTTAATKFQSGDRVQVADVIVGQGNMASYVTFHGQVVTVVNYWRNGNYIVREDEFQTTCAVDAKHLTAVAGPTADELAVAHSADLGKRPTW